MKIICIGRNYVEHIKELDNTDQLPSVPQFFMKPDTALLRNNSPFYVPAFSKQLDYETELVVRICRVGRSVEERFARRFYTEGRVCDRRPPVRIGSTRMARPVVSSVST